MEISEETRERVKTCKQYLENKYEELKKREEENTRNWGKLKDCMQEMGVDQEEQQKIKREIVSKIGNEQRRRR